MISALRNRITVQLAVTLALLTALVIAGFVVMAVAHWGAQNRRGIGNLAQPPSS
jgi:hypothetical protein